MRRFNSLEGGIPGTDGNAALLLFRESVTGQNMHAALTLRRECQRANSWRGRKRSAEMKLQEWFDNLCDNLLLEEDFEELHSVYRAINDDGGDWGYDVKKFSNGKYSITDSEGNKASYSKSEKQCFLDHLDAKYGDGLGVEGKWIMLKGYHKED